MVDSTLMGIEKSGRIVQRSNASLTVPAVANCIVIRTLKGC